RRERRPADDQAWPAERLVRPRSGRTVPGLTPAMLQDPLTGLHSRQKFLALLRQHVVIANERQSMLALIVVDLTGFARLNAAHGYDFGDAALKHVAQHLRAVVRDQDYVGRIGDNRFALLLTQVMNQGHAELAVQKLFRHLEVPFEGPQGTVRLTASVGAAICPVHASHPEFLMRQAEKSLALARATGQNWLFPPDVDVDQGFSEFWDLEIELDGAIEHGELLRSYQPKLRTSDLATIGAEALMSWPHRTRGLVSPNQFIPIAEKTGQIRPMTMWALNTAMRHAATWKHQSPLSVAVNVPAELVSRQDLPDIVENALQLWGKSDVQLVLEITERSLVADPHHSFGILSRIRDLGVKISIDDFGTGYSCLAYFKDPGRRAEDRQVLRPGHAHGPGQCRHRIADHRPGPPFRPVRGRRGGGERRNPGAAARAPLRRGPGPPVRQGPAAGRLPRLAPQPAIPAARVSNHGSGY